MCDNNENKRVPNFSTSETELLTTLVKKYSNVLENKKTDAVNNQLKEESWCKLAKDFNSTSGFYERSAKTLRAKYENLKKSLKRKYGEHRRSLYRTGGGPSQDINLTQQEEAILELAGPSVEGLPARFDCDTISDIKIIPESQVIAEVVVPNTQTCDTNYSLNTKVENKPITQKTKPATSEVQVETPSSRYILKRKRSTPLRNPVLYDNTLEEFSSLSKKKQNLVEAQLKSYEDKRVREKIEHELLCTQFENRARQEAREHDLKCELMQLEILLKKKELNK